MADYTPVASLSKPPQAMSLAEMVNLARGAQAYQQAEQANPLELQRSATELQRLQQLMPEEVRRATAEADVAEKTVKPRITSSTAAASTAESGAEEARLKLMLLKQKKIADANISMINHPLVIDAEKNPTAANVEALQNLIKRDGMNRARDLGIKPDEAMNLIQPSLDIAKTNPGALRGYFKQQHIQGLDDASRTGALSPSGVGITSGTESQVTSTNPFSEVEVGKAVPGTYRQLQLMPNEQIVEDTQGNKLIQSKDAQGKITIRPVSNAPTNAITNAPVSNQSVAPKKNALVEKLPQETPTNLPDYSQPVQPRFPVRQQGQPVFQLQQGEAEAQKSGGEYLKNVVAQRGSVSPIRTNLEKIISTTDDLLAKQGFKAGKGLQVEQYLTKLVDDSDYKILSKQLANLQMALIGNNPGALSSDAGKQMTAAASGTEVYPPKVLQKIVVQLHGEMENRDRQGIAADKYARKFGESNMPSFTQMWNNNADNKVFELMSLPKLIKDPQTRVKMANEIIGYPPGSEQRKVFEQKYMNIQKLIKDGTL